jgi:CDP-diacylglycerol---serine O-phosphatidyltransferase
MKRHIPNIFTSFNLFFGCVALVEVFRGQLITASYFIYAAAVLDLLDGLMARLFDAHSDFGKEMDSLADVVSFGVVPGAVMFSLLDRSNVNGELPQLLVFVPFIISVFSGLRLAKFNVDTRQTTSFIGLPTPANGLLIVSLPLIISQGNASLNAILLNPYFLLVSSLVLSYLLVSELPMFSLKFKSWAWKTNAVQYVFLAVSLMLLVVFLFKAIPVIIILYILFSFFRFVFAKQPESKL